MTTESTLPILRTAADLRTLVRGWRKQGLRIALVPTMGALHEGHLTLMRQALQRADRVVASVFVNPIQFGPNEDYDAYPRREAKDAALLAGAGVSALFAPTPQEMYPQGFATKITVGGPSQGLCGAQRPGHFDGVATVVTKLLMRVQPDIALFGEKDYQQLQVIRRFVRDLDIPVEIEGVPIVREADGLARSSRNAYLSAEERAVAPHLHRVIDAMAQALARGEAVAGQVAWGQTEIVKAGFASVDYLEVRDADSLVPVDGTVSAPARVLVAARLGKTRLIDNVPVIPA